jgi:hypothetical protein
LIAAPTNQSPIAIRYSLSFYSPFAIRCRFLSRLIAAPTNQSPIAIRYSLPFSLLSFHHPSHSYGITGWDGGTMVMSSTKSPLRLGGDCCHKE